MLKSRLRGDSTILKTDLITKYNEVAPAPYYFTCKATPANDNAIPPTMISDPIHQHQWTPVKIYRTYKTFDEQNLSFANKRVSLHI